MFEFFIDGVKYKNPINWADFTETIEFDDENKFIGLKYNNKLNFTGSAFQYLYNKKRTDGFCYEAEIVIVNTSCGTPEKFIGKIFISDCIFHLNRCEVECSIEDNNYGSLIFNNKSIAVFVYEQTMGGTFTKNGTPFTPTWLNPSSSTLYQAVKMFDPENGATTTDGVNFCLFPYDIFKFIITWITDDAVDFASTFLDYTLPVVTGMDKVKYLTVCLGNAIRTNQSGFTGDELMKISYVDLFKEVNLKYPLGAIIEYTSAGKPVLRIEDFATIRNASTSVQINNLTDVLEMIKNELLFGSVKIGSPVTDYDPTIHSYITTPELTDVEEKYYLQGQCNIDRVKDLVAKFVSDSNIIEELVIAPKTNASYDSDYFFIEVIPSTPAGVYEAIKTPNWDDANKYHYNDNLLNKYVMERNELANSVLDDELTGTSTVATNVPNQYFATAFEFSCPLSESTYQTIKSNMTRAIAFNIDGNMNKYGWIRSITRNRAKGDSRFELISNLNNSN